MYYTARLHTGTPMYTVLCTMLYTHIDICPCVATIPLGIFTRARNCLRCSVSLYHNVTKEYFSSVPPQVHRHVDDALSNNWGTDCCNLYLKHLRRFGSPFRCKTGAPLLIQLSRVHCVLLGLLFVRV